MKRTFEWIHRGLAVAAATTLLLLTPGLAEPSPTELEQQILHTLARGGDASELIATWQAGERRTRLPGRPLSSLATELSLALEGYQAAAGKAADPEALAAAATRLHAAHEDVLEHFREVENRLAELEIDGEVMARLRAAERDYASRVMPLVERLGADPAKGLPDASVLERLGDLLREPPAPILGANLLPYGPAGLAPREPVLEPVVLPSYQDPSATVPEGPDLAATGDAPLHPEIMALAEELGHNAVRIREYVRNQVATEWYAGSQKGALGTLRQGSGNDVDQASLLIALLRSSQVAARYVHGVVELPAAAVAADLRLGDPSRVPEALTRAGVACTPVIRGGRLAAVQVEHTWVAAFVPYSNYRGAVVDLSGATWLPLAPAVKAYDETPSAAVLRTMGLDVPGFVAASLATVQPATPLERLREQVETYLSRNLPDATYEEQLGVHAVAPERLGLLPSSLPVPVVAVTGEEAALSDEYRCTVRFVVRSAAGDSAKVVLDRRLSLAEVAGHRLTLSYMPATVDDHNTVNGFGGMSGVPLYLVRVRPHVKVDGRSVLAGEGSLDPGVLHRVEVELTTPAGTVRAGRDVTAGSYHAIAIGARVPIQVPEEDDPADSEPMAAALLAGLALRYDQQWTEAEDELGDLLGVTVVRPFASVAVVSDTMEVDYLAGMPYLLRFVGVSVDAIARAAEPFARSGDVDAVRHWQQLAALHGSNLEQDILEQTLLAGAISADEGLGLARDRGVDVVFMDQGPTDPGLTLLSHPAPVMDEIRNWLRLGMHVETPVEPMTVDAWTGSVWRVHDPASGAAGYFISGTKAGGTTTPPPDTWLLDFVVDALEAPYASEPNDDPLSGAEITKFPDTDNQTDTVDHVLPLPLTVEVRDQLGRPVQGVLVTFFVTNGQGKLLDDDDHELDALILATDRLGRAAVRFRLGQLTAADPTFLMVNRDDEHPTQALVNMVEAVADSHWGELVVEEPFKAFGLPDEPATLRRTNPQTLHDDGTMLALMGQWVDTVDVIVEDRFGNPVSNQFVRFEALNMWIDPTCISDQVNPLNAVVFNNQMREGGGLLWCSGIDNPLLGECGGPELFRRTRHKGTSAGVILGNIWNAVYTIRVTSGALPPLEYRYRPAYLIFPEEEECWYPHPVDHSVGPWVSDNLGHNINAVLAGGHFPVPIEVTLLYWKPEFQVAYNAGTETYYRKDLLEGTWVRTTGTIEFYADNGASVTPAAWSATKECYQTYVTTGPEPGKNTVRIGNGGAGGPGWTWVRTVEPAVDPDTGAVTWEERGHFLGALWGTEGIHVKVGEVWGLDPTIVGVDPTPIKLNLAGRTDVTTKVNFTIDPAAYIAGSVDLDLYENRSFKDSGTSADLSGEGFVEIQRGYPFDFDSTNRAELVINRGTPAEVRSPRFTLPLSQGIIVNYGTGVTPITDGAGELMFASQEVDVVNNRSCGTGTDFFFTLARDAEVTMTFHKVDSVNPDDLSPNLGAETVIIDNEELAEGEHRRMITVADLPAGRYVLELYARATSDGLEESRYANVVSEYRVRDSVPVGHAMVEGVDLFDGHLTVGREDLRLPGRGTQLSFSRTYSSNASAEPGRLGVGWVHNWESSLVITRCGEVILMGGDGSGMRFVDDGDGNLVPLKGYHGTLIANPDDYSFDFYSKSGNRSHYVHVNESQWHLLFMEDPNGNRTELIYGGEPRDPLLTAVVDSSGRMLRFTYEHKSFAFHDTDVITRIDGPDGLSVSFEYDAWGNLARAAREALMAESYTYRLPPDYPLEQAHLMASRSNEINGATTLFDYTYAAIGLQGDIHVPSFNVATLTRPEGGVVGFTFDVTGLNDRAPPEITTVVNDARGFDTTYVLNQYGSPVTTTDPEGHSTILEWATRDVFLEARTDRNGTRTEYLYNDNGDIVEETVTFDDPDNANNQLQYTTLTTYWENGRVQASPTASLVDLQPPYIKCLVKSVQDRNGNLTELFYDSRGNLTERRFQVTDADGRTRTAVVQHTYDDRGDRRSSTDPLGYTTFFEYDANGNLATMTRPDGAVTRTEWNARGLPARVYDGLGRETLLEYDTLGRPVRKVFPLAAGDSGPPEEVVEYLDAAHTTRQTDAGGAVTVTTFDLEGRPVHIVNAEGAQRDVIYDGEGLKTSESNWYLDARDRVFTGYTYDDAGRLEEITQPEGRVVTYVRDGSGAVLESTISDATDTLFTPRVTTYDYDGLGRRIQITRHGDDGDLHEQLRYDPMGHKVLERDALGRETTFEYDEVGKLIRKTAPDWRTGTSTVVEFLYDLRGNLAQERRHNQQRTPLTGQFQTHTQVRRFEYDPMGRLLETTDAEGGTTVFSYDLNGNLAREIDPRLNVVSHVYDERNRRTQTIRHLDRVTNPGRDVTTYFEYDAVGNLLRERLPNGNVRERVYDRLGRLRRSYDALGTLMEYDYDANGNQVQVTDANGNVTVNHFDDLNRLYHQELPEDRTITVTYDVMGNVTSSTDSRDNTSTFVYDRLDRLVETIDPLVDGASEPYSSSFTYDALGNLRTATDRKGFVTTYDYDDLDRLTSVISPPLAPATTGLATHITYDAVGNTLTITDRRGIVNELVYDRENRLLEAYRDSVKLRTMRYDANDNLVAESDANGNTSTFEYDERNLLVAANRPLAAITRYTLDDMGDVVQERDPEGRITRRSYDLRRRLATQTNGENETTGFAYDGNGNLTTVTPPKGNATVFGYDDADRLVSVTDPMSHLTEYDYDGNGNLTLVTDAGGGAYTFHYDQLNRLRRKEFAGGGEATYVYDPNGNVVQLTDPKGQVLHSDYDELNRLTLQTYPAPADPLAEVLDSIGFTYDGNNNLRTATEVYDTGGGTRTTRLHYDSFDRLTGVTDGFGKSVGYEYDANGNRVRLTDADGAVTRYTYDALNRVSTVTMPGAGTATYVYDRSSLPDHVEYPNGTRADFDFDDATRLTDLVNTFGPAVLSSYQYTYDLNGNRLSQVEINGGAAETTTYAYDTADRLVEVVYPDMTTSYTLDSVGNRLTEDSVDNDRNPVLSRTYGYNIRNQLLTITDHLDPTHSIAYGYDANGNTISKTRDGITTDFRYDVRNQLAEVDHDGSELARFSYDYRGLRILKHSLSGQFRYVYDQSSVLQQTNALGETVAKYDYGPNALLSVAHFSEGRSYYHFDGLGSIVNLTDSSGSVQARNQYDAWGNFRDRAGDRFNPFGFTGHEWDEETGLYYAKARFYDPDVGRFLSEDPFQGDPRSPPSLHRYLYAVANPTAFVDPDGNIAILKRFQEWLQDGKEAAFELADEYKNTDFAETAVGKYVGVQVGVATGVLAGCMSITEGMVGIANTATNVAVMATAPDSELANEAAGEVDETIDSLKAAYEYVKEDPLAAGAAVINSGKETLKGLAEGDPRAVAEVTAVVTEIAVDIATSGGSKSAAKAADNVAGELAEAATEAAAEKMLKNTKRAAEEIADAAEAAGKGTRRAARETAEAAEEAAETIATRATRNADEAAEAAEAAATATKKAPNSPKTPDGIDTPSSPKGRSGSRSRGSSSAAEGAGKHTPQVDPNSPATLNERLTAYKAWRKKKGGGKPTSQEFRNFRAAHRPGSKGKTLYNNRPGFRSDAYSRPSFRSKMREQVWEAAKDIDGNVYDPKTGDLMNFDDAWDMGHKPGYEFWKHQRSARQRGIPRERFIDEYNTPEHFHPELPSSNRSHSEELPGDIYFGP